MYIKYFERLEIKYFIKSIKYFLFVTGEEVVLNRSDCVSSVVDES